MHGFNEIGDIVFSDVIIIKVGNRDPISHFVNGKTIHKVIRDHDGAFVVYDLSTLDGSSGGLISNGEGQWIGCHKGIINSRDQHGNRITVAESAGYGLLLDSPLIMAWIQREVIPLLPIEIRRRWQSFCWVGGV